MEPRGRLAAKLRALTACSCQRCGPEAVPGNVGRAGRSPQEAPLRLRLDGGHRRSDFSSGANPGMLTPRGRARGRLLEGGEARMGVRALLGGQGSPGKWYWKMEVKLGLEYSTIWINCLDLSFPGGTAGKEPTCQCKRSGLEPWVGNIPWGRAWQPTPVFLPEESHGQRSLVS